MGVLPPCPCGLASRADRLLLPLLFHRPLEQGQWTRAWGFRLRPFGLTGSSVMNSAQENSDCCGSSASSWWPLAGTSSTVGPMAS